MQEEEKTLDVVEENVETVSDEALQQFIFDDSQLSYYNEYSNLYIDNQYATC
jgi:hypothetical protein